MKIQTLITTFNRPKQLSLLLNDIHSQEIKTQITVFDDGSEPPVKNAVRFQHFGKRRYYQLITAVFESLRPKKFDYFFLLPDDIRLPKDFFELSIRHWEIITDPQKICLSVGHTHDRTKRPCWTHYYPVPMGDIILTNWNDLCFMAEKKFLDVLNFKIEQPKPGYNYASSGVGRYISKALYELHYHQYHTTTSLCNFPANVSMMGL